MAKPGLLEHSHWLDAFRNGLVIQQQTETLGRLNLEIGNIQNSVIEEKCQFGLMQIKNFTLTKLVSILYPTVTSCNSIWSDLPERIRINFDSTKEQTDLSSMPQIGVYVKSKDFLNGRYYWTKQIDPEKENDRLFYIQWVQENCYNFSHTVCYSIGSTGCKIA